jgi:ABC-type multidrug transport system permease subunit
MGSLITLPLMAFSGMYNKLNNTPTWISWMQYISPFRYGLQMILVNQYEDLRIPIVQNGSIIDYYVYNEDLAFDPFW